MKIWNWIFLFHWKWVLACKQSFHLSWLNLILCNFVIVSKYYLNWLIILIPFSVLYQCLGFSRKSLLSKYTSRYKYFVNIVNVILTVSVFSGSSGLHSKHSLAYNILHRCLQVSTKNLHVISLHLYVFVWILASLYFIFPTLTNSQDPSELFKATDRYSHHLPTINTNRERTVCVVFLLHISKPFRAKIQYSCIQTIINRWWWFDSIMLVLVVVWMLCRINLYHLK